MRKVFQQRAILIIRLTAVGDIVLASPIASSLKSQNPNTTISWLVHKEYAPLLEGHPDVDEVISIDVNDWSRLWRGGRIIEFMKKAFGLKKQLNERRFERTIDLQGNGTSGVFAWLSGAKHRIALGSEGTNSWFMTKTISKNLGDQTQIGCEYRYLANQLGASDNQWQMFVPLSKSANQKAKSILSDTVGDASYAVICPHGQQDQKCWFEDYWLQIILRIRGRYQLKTVILGSDGGSEMGERLARASGAINLSGKTSLKETTAIIANASLLLGVDTGFTHMGHAVSVPTISLFGATHPYGYVDSELSKVIYLDRYCSPCHRHPICKKQYHCMRDITPDQVLTAIKTLLKRANQQIQAS